MVLASTCAVRQVLHKRAEQKRESAYQLLLRSYSEDLKPGMARQDVENYLNGKGARFSQMCCVAQNRDALDDITKIGQELAPWYCSVQNIYVAFQFTPAGRDNALRAEKSDRLISITIIRRLEGCL